MNIQERKLENSTIELTINIGAEKVDKEFDKVYKKIQESAKIDGFRKGKAPIDIIKTRFVSNAEQQVVENIVKDNYYEALQEKKIIPIAHPSFDFDKITTGAEFSFKAVVEVAPTVELKDYFGISAEEKQCNVNDKDVDFEIDNMREKQAEISKKEDGSAVENGDQVNIEVKRIDNLKKEEIDNEQYHHLSVVAGKNTEDHNFDKYVTDMKVDEEKEVKFKYPKTYHVKDLAGQKVVYKLKIKEINNRKLPNLDDDFAKDLGEFDSLEDLKAKTKDNLEKYVLERSKGEAKSQILQQIIENSTFDIPKTLIEQEKQSIFQRLQQRMGFPVDDMEKFANAMGMKLEDFSNKLADEALQSIKSTLVLSEISKAEKLEVSDEKYNEAVKNIADKHQKSVEEINDQIEKSGAKRNIQSEILFDQAMDLIYDKANIKKLSAVSVKEFMQNNN